jgi:hypothetical protein
MVGPFGGTTTAQLLQAAMLHPERLGDPVAMSDSFFPRMYMRSRCRVPIGTVTLTPYFHVDSALLTQVGTRHVPGVAKALNYRDGYFDQPGKLWSPEGQLLASTHQLVYFKD